MNKTDRKAIEKVALSAYAEHLYDGLTFKGNYTLGEVIRYWRYAKEDAGAMCPQLSADSNIFQLLNSYQYNVKKLEAEIARRIEAAKNEPQPTSKEDRIELAVAQLPETFELSAFPGVPMRIVRAYSYVNDSDQLQLVIERIDSHQHFGKGTLAEIRAQIAGGAQ